MLWSVLGKCCSSVSIKYEPDSVFLHRWDREVVTKAVDSGLFPLPQGVNATRDVFNVTSRLGTDGEFAYVFHGFTAFIVYLVC